MIKIRVVRGIVCWWYGILGKIRTGSRWIVWVCLRNIFQERKRKIIIVEKREKVGGF